MRSQALATSTPPSPPPPCTVDEPPDNAVLERITKNLKKLKYKRLVAVAKKLKIKTNVDGVQLTGKQLAEEVLKVLNA